MLKKRLKYQTRGMPGHINPECKDEAESIRKMPSFADSPLRVKPAFSASPNTSLETAVLPQHHNHHHQIAAQRSLFSGRSGVDSSESTGLPRGMRKKVTTSLFAVTCLLALNLFGPLFTPSQTSGVLVANGVGVPNYDGAKNIGIGQSGKMS